MAKRRGKARTGPGAPGEAAAQTAHTGANSTGGTEERTRETQDRFLSAFAEFATVSEAARAASIGRRTHYLWLETDDDYRNRFADAEAEAADALLKEARARAKDRSDRLLVELLRAFMPDRFARRLEHTGKNGAPIAHAVTVRRDLSALSDEQLAAAEDIARTLEAVKGPECPECQSRATRTLAGGTCTCTTCGASWTWT